MVSFTVGQNRGHSVFSEATLDKGDKKMKKISLFVFVACVIALLTGCPSSYRVNGPNGPEYVSKTGPFGGTDVVVNNGTMYDECKQYANMDPSLMPASKFAMCRSMSGAGGYPMMGAGGYNAPYVMVTPGQAAMMQYPGSAAIVAAPTPQVYPPDAGTTMAPGTTAPSAGIKDKVARKAIVELDDKVNDLKKEVCGKKSGKACKSVKEEF